MKMDGIVVPGFKVATAPRQTTGSFVENNETYAATMGLVKDGRFIPLKGYYVPVAGDYIIGVVADVFFSSYEVDVNSPYDGSISTRDVREEFTAGDVVSATIIDTNEMHEAVLGEPRKFTGGRMMEVSHVKIPRIIGRNASMVQMIKDYTRTDVFVGKNGRIYLRGGNVALAEMAILKIDAEAHTNGLTDRVKTFLEKNALTE